MKRQEIKEQIISTGQIIPGPQIIIRHHKKTTDYIKTTDHKKRLPIYDIIKTLNQNIINMTQEKTTDLTRTRDHSRTFRRDKRLKVPTCHTQIPNTQTDHEL